MAPAKVAMRRGATLSNGSKQATGSYSMSPRIKKLLGLLIILPGLFAYIIVAITIADYVPNHKIVQFIYFAIAGIAWVFPLKPLFIWMNSEPNR